MARADSTAFAIEAAQALAAPVPQPPQQLSFAALQFWERVYQSKRPDAWTPSDLVLGCALCRDMALIETLSTELEKDGPTLENKEGRMYPHPAATLLDSATRRVLATTRSLQIHAKATCGPTHHQPGKNGAARGIAEDLDTGDDLIARPGAAH